MPVRGVRRFKSMGEFGGHSRGGGTKFLSKWKEKGSIEVWYHCQELPMAVYRHQIPQIVTITKDGDKENHVWSKNLVCHETETVLDAQYFRDKETGIRKHPPERCSLCKLVEWAYQQCITYEEDRENEVPTKKRRGMAFTTPIFRFESDFGDETTTLHLGGLCNLFNKDLNDAQKKELKTAGIRRDHAWKENAWARCQYVMVVVDDAHPDKVQIAVEASSLGDKVKKVLDQELENDVDITKTPYCIKWKYDEKQTNINEKYAAVALRKKIPGPRILKLIRGEPPPLPDDLTVPFNQQSLRATLERHCILAKGVVPWDEIFPSTKQEAQWKKEDAEEAKREAAEEDSEEDEESPSSEEGEEEEEEDEEEDDGMVECDKCDEPMPADAAECTKCGQKYDVTKEKKEGEEEDEEEDEEETEDEEEEEEEDEEETEEEEEEEKPPPKKAMKKRTASGGGGGGSSKKRSASAAISSNPEDDTDQGSSIPF